MHFLIGVSVWRGTNNNNFAGARQGSENCNFSMNWLDLWAGVEKTLNIMLREQIRKSCFTYVFYLFFYDFLFKIGPRTSGVPSWSSWLSMDVPRPHTTHFTSLLHFWIAFDRNRSRTLFFGSENHPFCPRPFGTTLATLANLYVELERS